MKKYKYIDRKSKKGTKKSLHPSYVYRKIGTTTSGKTTYIRVKK